MHELQRKTRMKMIQAGMSLFKLAKKNKLGINLARSAKQENFFCGFYQNDFPIALIKSTY